MQDGREGQTARTSLFEGGLREVRSPEKTYDREEGRETKASQTPQEVTQPRKPLFGKKDKGQEREVQEGTIAYGPKEGKDHPVYFSLNVPSECLVLDGPGSLTPYGNGRESTSRDGKSETPEDG